jgi:ribosomal protein L33
LLASTLAKVQPKTPDEAADVVATVYKTVAAMKPKKPASKPKRGRPSTPIVEAKWCPKCQSYQLLSNFYARKTGKKTYYASECKDCAKKVAGKQYVTKKANAAAELAKLNPLKYCPHCKTDKPLSSFYASAVLDKHNSMKVRTSPYCIDCQKQSSGVQSAKKKVERKERKHQALVVKQNTVTNRLNENTVASLDKEKQTRSLYWNAHLTAEEISQRVHLPVDQVRSIIFSSPLK